MKTVKALSNTGDYDALTIDIVKVDNAQSGYNVLIELQLMRGARNVSSGRIILTTDATGNCQTLTLGYLNMLVQYLDYCSNSENVKALERFAFAENVMHTIIAELNKETKPALYTKRQFIVDYKTVLKPKVERFFKLLISTEYESTNGSAMSLGIIKLERPIIIKEE